MKYAAKINEQKVSKQLTPSAGTFSNEMSAKPAETIPPKEKKIEVATGFSFSSSDSQPAKNPDAVTSFPASSEFSVLKPPNNSQTVSSKGTQQAPAQPFEFAVFGGDKKEQAPFSLAGSSFPGFGEKKAEPFSIFSGGFSFPSSGFPSAGNNMFGVGTPSMLPVSSSTLPATILDPDEAEDDDAEGEEFTILEPEKVERNKDDTDEILHECAKCKLFKYKNESKEWTEFGKGVFRVARDSETKKKRILIRNMTGRVVLNVSFYPGMSFSKVGKNGIRFMAFVDNSGTPQLLMVKVKEEEFDKTLSFLKSSVV